MTYRYSVVHLDLERSLLQPGIMSLKHYWRHSGGRWTKLKRLIKEHKGARCTTCSASDVTLDAHEVWEHISAYKAGIAPLEIRQVMKVHRAEVRKRDAATERFYLARAKPLPSYIKKRPRALVRALTDIKLLCQQCHRAEHLAETSYHRDFVLASYYSGFDELPEFRTFAEWQAAMQDEASLRDEDERPYWLPGRNNFSAS